MEEVGWAGSQTFSSYIGDNWYVSRKNVYLILIISLSNKNQAFKWKKDPFILNMNVSQRNKGGEAKLLVIAETLARISHMSINNNCMSPDKRELSLMNILAFCAGWIFLDNEENREYNLFKFLKCLEQVFISKDPAKFIGTIKCKVTDEINMKLD